MGDNERSFWEESKENIQPIKSGRKIGLMDQALKLDEEVVRKTILDFEHRIRISEKEEKINIWYNYISWMQQSNLYGPRKILRLMKQCTTSLNQLNDDYFNTNEKYVEIWIGVAEQLDDPQAIFEYMLDHEIGTSLSLFYKAIAEYYEFIDAYKKADSLYQLGINRNAKPNDTLQVAYQSFLWRLSQRKQGKVAPIHAEETSRKILGKLRSSKSGYVGNNRSKLLDRNGDSGFPKSMSKKGSQVQQPFQIYGGDENNENVIPTGRRAIKHIPTKSQNNENLKSIETVGGAKVNGGVKHQKERFEIFQEQTEDSDIKKYSHSVTITSRKPLGKHVGEQNREFTDYISQKPPKDQNVIRKYSHEILCMGGREVSFEELKAAKYQTLDIQYDSSKGDIFAKNLKKEKIDFSSSDFALTEIKAPSSNRESTFGEFTHPGKPCYESTAILRHSNDVKSNPVESCSPITTAKATEKVAIQSATDTSVNKSVKNRKPGYELFSDIDAPEINKEFSNDPVVSSANSPQDLACDKTLICFGNELLKGLEKRYTPHSSDDTNKKAFSHQSILPTANNKNQSLTSEFEGLSLATNVKNDVQQQPQEDYYKNESYVQKSSSEPQVPSIEQQKPSKELQMPSRELQMPSIENQKATRELQIPSIEQQKPSREPQIPSRELQIPSIEQQKPSREPQIPSRDLEIPSVEQQKPSKEPQIPSRDLEIPSIKQQKPSEPQIPSREQQKPSRELHIPFGDLQKPSREQKKPSKELENPFRELQMPTLEQKIPSIEQREPSSEQFHDVYTKSKFTSIDIIQSQKNASKAFSNDASSDDTFACKVYYTAKVVKEDNDISSPINIAPDIGSFHFDLQKGVAKENPPISSHQFSDFLKPSEKQHEVGVSEDLAFLKDLADEIIPGSSNAQNNDFAVDSFTSDPFATSFKLKQKNEDFDALFKIDEKPSNLTYNETDVNFFNAQKIENDLCNYENLFQNSALLETPQVYSKRLNSLSRNKKDTSCLGMPSPTFVTKDARKAVDLMFEDDGTLAFVTKETREAEKFQTSHQNIIVDENIFSDTSKKINENCNLAKKIPFQIFCDSNDSVKSEKDNRPSLWKSNITAHTIFNDGGMKRTRESGNSGFSIFSDNTRSPLHKKQAVGNSQNFSKPLPIRIEENDMNFGSKLSSTANVSSVCASSMSTTSFTNKMEYHEANDYSNQFTLSTIAEASCSDSSKNSTHSEVSVTRNIDPFTRDFVSKSLDNIMLKVESFTNYIKLSGTLPRLQGARVDINLGPKNYRIVKLLSKNDSTSVYRANDEQNQSVSIQISWRNVSSMLWDFFISNEVQRRLQNNQLSIQNLHHKCFVQTNFCFDYDDAVCTESAYFSDGSLQDIINLYSKFNTPFDEILVVYYAYQILQVVDILHSMDIIHCNITPSQFLQRSSDFTSNIFLFRCIALKGFQNAIDLRQHKNTEIMFVGSLPGDKAFRCTEMRNNKPWKYQVDHFAAASTLHLLVFQNCMNTFTDPESGKLRIADVPPSDWQYGKFWSHLFSSLINSTGDIRVVKELVHELELFLKESDAAENLHTAVTKTNDLFMADD